MRAKAALPPRGKAKNLYFKGDDLTRIRELATFISGKGHRVSDSQVIAAALRVVKPDAKLLRAFEEGLLLDARYRRDE